MLNPVQTERMLSKLERMENTYRSHLFESVRQMEFEILETADEFFSVPESADWRKIGQGEAWGRPRSYGWFRGLFEPAEELIGERLYLCPHTGGVEGLLYVDGVPRGIFTPENGNHSCACITMECTRTPMQIALEMYTGHAVIGTQPLSNDPAPTGRFICEGAAVCRKNSVVAQFLFDLRALRQLAQQLSDTDFRKAEVVNCLTEVFRAAVQAPDDCGKELWEASLLKSIRLMAPCLAEKNSSSAPIAGIVGHSHMDTAWKWPLEVTVKKCARTYANQINLMDQYPEYRFIQSSAYHLELMRRYYPGLFRKISEKIAEGRYEPNGGVWVECDCNIPSGESMIRQFLWGQRYTEKYFGYRSNCFWLPDTFGYSAAIPQIMKGCGVDYFLTTKLSWNDTNRFPWETFYWEGMDGTKVFTHFNTIQCWPDPGDLIPRLNGVKGGVAYTEKRVTGRRLISYGYGDGGGGPQFEMIEMARRCKDLEGCPRTEYVNAGDFLKKMEETAYCPPVHSGELYLELHRGTLTNQHQIKVNNRKAEIALHHLELAEVLSAVQEGRAAASEKIAPLTEILLLNQFHDILPGTCIEEVHVRAERQVSEMIRKAEAETQNLFQHDQGWITILNPLGFQRKSTIYFKGGAPLAECKIQKTRSLNGETMWAADGIVLQPLSAAALPWAEGEPKSTVGSAFCWDGTTLTTPFARIAFGEGGALERFFDLRLNRELRSPTGYPLNTFLFGEDLPAAWDNWDIDPDLALKLEPAGELLSREVISDGMVEFRLRCRYRLTEKTDIWQDMVFYASSARVDFETVIDWHERHRFLKAAFDVDMRSSFARNEIQFGCCQRPTTRNTSQEQAMFEVLNHRYTDLSEADQGISVLNNGKYGVSVEGGQIHLSLHKGGCRPDDRGDAGKHAFTYSFYPHADGFGSNVVREGYLLNNPPIQIFGRCERETLAWVDRDNVIIETVKPCEDSEKAFVLRLYESVGTHARTVLHCSCAVGFQICNMLEEPEAEVQSGRQIELEFRPFSIQTVKVFYREEQSI